jgi:hypothetical protein
MGQGFVWFCFFARLQPPHRNSLDEYLEFLIPKVRYFGEDLAEEHFYLHKRWLEINPRNTQSVVLHIFEPIMSPNELGGPQGSNHLRITNGDVSTGAWSYMKGNKMIIQHPSQELYDLGFLNPYFFIVRKHGSNLTQTRSKYLVLVSERGTRGIMQRAIGTSEVSVETIAELLYLYYLYNNFITGFILIGVPIIFLVLYILF